MLREEVRAHVALEQDNVADFLAALEAMMAGDAHFKQIQAKLERQIMAQVDPASVLRVVAKTLDAIVSRPDAAASGASSSSSKPLTHLLLELLPGAVERCPEGPAAVKEEAAQLLLACCSARHARVAPKVAVNFRITDADLRANGIAGAVEEFVAELLTDSATLNPAVTLLLQFPSLRAKFPLEPILNDIVALGEERIAERFVEGLGGVDAKRQLVTACIAGDRLKEASNFVRQWGLQEDFPDVQRQYKVRAIGKLVERQVWDVAVQFAGDERDLQELVLRNMVIEGEIALAEIHRQEWSLPADILEVDPAIIAAEQARERETYLQLDIPPERVHFVSEPREVEAMLPRLCGAAAVGLDTEWRCFREPGQSEKGTAQRPVALMQLGNGEEVFLVDMTVLGGDPALDAGLEQIMVSESTAIVGLEIAGDLKMLASSFPEMRAFKAVNRVVELQRVWGNLTVSKEGAGGGLGPVRQGNVKKKSGMGLSSLSQLVLGRPLNKAMQVSNWEARPLSARQVTYAALDAHVCVRLLEAMQQEDPDCTGGSATFSWPAHPKRKAQGSTKRRGQRRGGDDDDGGGDDTSSGGGGRGGPRGSVEDGGRTAAAATTAGQEGEGHAGSGSGIADGGSHVAMRALEGLQMLARACQPLRPRPLAALCKDSRGVPVAAALVLLLAGGSLPGTCGPSSRCRRAAPSRPRHARLLQQQGQCCSGQAVLALQTKPATSLICPRIGGVVPGRNDASAASSVAGQESENTAEDSPSSPGQAPPCSAPARARIRPCSWLADAAAAAGKALTGQIQGPRAPSRPVLLPLAAAALPIIAMM